MKVGCGISIRPTASEYNLVAASQKLCTMNNHMLAVGTVNASKPIYRTLEIVRGKCCNGHHSQRYSATNFRAHSSLGVIPCLLSSITSSMDKLHTWSQGMRPATHYLHYERCSRVHNVWLTHARTAYTLSAEHVVMFTSLFLHLQLCG